jgi:peptide/nickel transport system ATP-binding protein
VVTVVTELLLEIKNLHVGYRTYRGTSKVLNDVSLAVNAREKIGIIGESGCGKTTTMKTVLAVLPSNAVIEKGEILFRGKDILRMNKSELTEVRRKHIAMIFQDPTAALNPVFKVGTQLVDVMKYSGTHGSRMEAKEFKARSIQLFKEVALSDPDRVFDSYPFQLSGGMRQRICIAMSLATPTDLLIADEPTTNLDVTIQDQVLRLIKDIAEKRDLSTILISHALGAVKDFVDRVYVMYAGNIVETAEAAELFSNPLHPYTQGLLSSTPKLTGGGFSEGIRGRVPDYISPPRGCRFHPRCNYSLDMCRKEKPPFIDVEGNHSVACWRYHKD